MKLLRELPADLKARFSGFFDMNYHHPKCEQRSASETITGTTISASSDLSGTADTSSTATGATAELPEEEVSNGRPRGIRNNELLLAVAAYMVEHKR